MQCLPDNRADAATNMAIDQVMLTEYPASELPRFRHYAWQHSAFTFGFAQSWGKELENLVSEGHEVIRRETGGGLVDHRNDWTYGLVIPLSHQRGQESPTAVYQDVHACMVEAIQKQNIDAGLQPKAPPPNSNGTFNACFNKAELNDVITREHTKIAGAAQRRNRSGFLVQGSISRLTLPQLDWTRFKMDFVESLSLWLDSPAEKTDWPSWNLEAIDKLKTQFASEAWNKKRKR